MPGGNFGGAGATASWSRPRGGGGNRPRAGVYTRKFKRRSSGVRGANVHFITSQSIEHLTGEANPIRSVIPFIHAGAWLDMQYDANQLGKWEGTLDPVHIVSARFRLDVWPSYWIPAAIVHVPTFMALAVIPLNDPTGAGNPNDFAPVTLPNLFLRDWGRISADPSSPDPGSLLPTLAIRVVYRTHELINVSEINQADTLLTTRFVRLRNIWVPRNAALCFCWGAYNVHNEDNCTLGFRVSGTFGYRHQTRT